MKVKNMIGQRFGRLIVISYIGSGRNRGAMWLCQCDCGKTTKSSRTNLIRGAMKSCGCEKNERVSILNKIHGMTRKRPYRIWQNMKTRCLNPKYKQWENYGGRGITICDEWKDNFQAFYDWAIANGYADNLTIDRINNDGNYCPENCRWTTMAEQNKNRGERRWQKKPQGGIV